VQLPTGPGEQLPTMVPSKSAAMNCNDEPPSIGKVAV
jgi:hypothetical protein